MAKIEIPDPEVLRSKALPKNVYPATITDIVVDYGPWGDDHPNVQRLAFKFLLDEHPEVPEASGRTVSIMCAAAPERGDLLLRICAGLGVSVAEFDTDDWVGRQVLVGLTPGVNKRTGLATDNLSSIALMAT